jgi:hypothetical protein
VKRPGQYTHTATIWILLSCLLLAVSGCSDEEPVEPVKQKRVKKAPEPVVREWYPTPKHMQQHTLQPMQQRTTAQPGVQYQQAQQPQVIIVQPAYQPQFAQPQQQPATPWQQPAYSQQVVPQPQYAPQYQTPPQYGQRPWGETGSYGQSWTGQPAGGGQQQTFGTPYGAPPAPVYPGWGVSPPGTFPGNPYPGSIW